MAKFKDLYKQELHNIKQLSREFAEAHPDVAPMLRDKSTDPDVERLLEGFAYVSAQIREIIDDQIPEFSGSMIKKFFPHYLRPLPSSTIMAFKPKAELSEPFTVKAGASFASIPVNGTTCRFRLCSDCEVKPVSLDTARIVKKSGEQHYIELNFSLSGVDLSAWWTDSLRFHLGGNYSDAAQLYYILLRFIDRVEINSGEYQLTLAKACIVPEGFTDKDAILPYPGHANTSYRTLQEYFLMPEKYLYISLNSLDQWKERGQSERFQIRFYLNNQVKDLPEISNHSFLLHTAPAINLFEYDAKPIVLNHMQYQYPVQPDTSDRAHYPIYTIKSVQGYRQGRVQAKKYEHIDDVRNSFNKKLSSYDVVNKSSITGDGLDSYITIIYNEEDKVNEEETLSVLLECSNGSLPEYLARGEINLPTGNSPSLLSFENLYVPTTYKIPPEDDEWMWRLQSMLSVSYLSIADAENLRSLLRFYLFLNKSRHVTRTAFQRQINSIEGVQIENVNRMVTGILMRGQKIKIKCRFNDFASEGEAFLFVSVIDRFLATYVAMNSFTILELTDSSTGEKIVWPMRMGEQLLS